MGAGLRFDAIRLMLGKLRRQRDVFQSKQLAVKALIDRQTDRTDPATELLKEWHRELGGPLGTRTSLALARSRFRADSRLLQLVQMMAVSPVGRWLS